MNDASAFFRNHHNCLHPNLGTATAEIAVAAGNSEAALHLARRWWTGCHVVGAAGHGTDMAPPLPFETIAREWRGNERRLRAWLVSPHPPMPNFSLSGK
jgi:hypothetical protein